MTLDQKRYRTLLGFEGQGGPKPWYREEDGGELSSLASRVSAKTYTRYKREEWRRGKREEQGEERKGRKWGMRRKSDTGTKQSIKR